MTGSEPSPSAGAEPAGDDAIIGRAMRISLLALVALAVPVGLVLWLLSRGEDRPPPIEADVQVPRASVRPIEPPRVLFTDITAQAGITFERENGASGDKFLPETMGGGVAFLDCELDGDPDLLFVNGRSWDGSGASGQALYVNDGSGRFEDRSSAAGLDIAMQGTGVAVGDWDGDADPDLYLAGVGEERLLRNEAGRFADWTASAGIVSDPQRWCTGAAFFDADRDGDLDLFVCSYVRWTPAIDREVDYRLTGVGRAYGPPTDYPGDHSRLLFNAGDGRFEDGSARAGIQVSNEATGVPVGKALGVAPVDVDGDGWTDLVVANDTVRNFLFLNRGDGSFIESGLGRGLAYDRNGKATGAMGIDAADYRNDGQLGLAIGNFAGEMTTLYVAQAGARVFADESIVEGLGAPSRAVLSFGLFFFDYDLDGRQDLLQVNGHLEEEIAVVQPSQSYRQAPQLFWNVGPETRATFVEVEQAGDLLERELVGRGCAYADIEGDGDLDVVLAQSRGAPVLLRNDQALGHHWLRVRLRDRGANTAGIGARVVLRSGGSTQTRTLRSSRGYLSAVEPVAHFGLGREPRVESLEIIWPDGERQRVPVSEPNRVLEVERSAE